jgi:excinuclease ABC subunit A
MSASRGRRGGSWRLWPRSTPVRRTSPGSWSPTRTPIMWARRPRWPLAPAGPWTFTRRLVVRGAREHNLKDISSRLCPATPSSCSPGCPARASPAWRSTRSSPRGSAATSSPVGLCPPVPRPDGQARRRLHRGPLPAVSIDQKSTNRNPRSTVGTITEVYDYLRLLFARVGARTAPPVVSHHPPEPPADRRPVLELPERTRFQVLAPVVRARKGEYVDLFAELQTKGFSRARVDGEVVALDDPPKLEKQIKHTIEVVVDRLTPRGTTRRQATAHRLGRDRPRLAGGMVVVDFVDRERPIPTASGGSPSGWPAPTTTRSPSTSSSRARSRSTRPFGACPECTGLGTRARGRPRVHRPRRGPQPREGALAPWGSGQVGRLLPARSGGHVPTT